MTQLADVSLRIMRNILLTAGRDQPRWLPTVFVRLMGVPCVVLLRYKLCLHRRADDDLDAIRLRVARHGAHYVTVTVASHWRKKTASLYCMPLCDAGYQVSLETRRGADVSGVDRAAW